MKRDEATKLVDEGITALNNALKNGQSETLKRFLDTVARFHHYSLNNALLIAGQRPDATRVAGFHAWRKLGRCVRKGERGIAIVAPMSCRKSGDERETIVDDEQATVFGFRVVYVFDITQTDGEPILEFAVIRGDAAIWLPHFEETVREAGVILEYVPIHFPMGAKGISTPGSIRIAPDLPESEKFSVLAHEFAHELLHQRTERTKETTRQVRETEAEAVAYTVCRAFGIDSTTHSSDYIQLYQGTEDTLRESLGFVQQAATHMIQEIRRRSDAKADSAIAVLAA